MPPRIPGLPGLPGLPSFRSALCFRPAPMLPAPPAPARLRGVVTISGTRRHREKKQARKAKELKMHRLRTVDPYLLSQKERRLHAALDRKKTLADERQKAWGSPVHGLTTPFVESFDSAGQDAWSRPPLDDEGRPLEEPHKLPTSGDLMNHNLTRTEILETLEYAQALTQPYVPPEDPNSPNGAHPAISEHVLKAHADRHAKVAVAFERIFNLTNAGGKHLRHANIRRCIETFGRHNTDQTLENASPLPPVGKKRMWVAPRAGPDTGSSEVQIAILTMKIRALAKSIEAPKGNNDKHNKRNLRKMCHKRQKLLKYMERKERGSGRWHFMLETLGLSPATWKRQIEIR